jgi:hypothetical protein
MPLVQTRGAASAQGFGEFSQPAGPANYIEDVFSTYLYTGTGAAQTITNGIDLAGKGGMVWTKQRSSTRSNNIVDTVRGGDNMMYTDTTDAQFSLTGLGFSAFTFSSTGFVASNAPVNAENANTFCSWTFREQAKFFDVVTYTGTGSARTIAHNLGSEPGMIIVKATSTTTDWAVYHRSAAASGYTAAQSYLRLNLTNAVTDNAVWNNTAPTSTVFSVGSGSPSNSNGITYVAYLFAHDAGGFGTSGTDNVISCGSYTNNSAAPVVVNLGYEPQYLLIKQVTTAGNNWQVVDTMRGMSYAATQNLQPNTSNAESSPGAVVIPTATGFEVNPAISSDYNSTATTGTRTYIYMAIRRGPMKVPTTGTSVFAITTFTGVDTAQTAGFPVDFVPNAENISATTQWQWVDRLRGANIKLASNTTAAEGTVSDGLWDSNTQVRVTSSGNNYKRLYPMFRRASGFFDEVCYTGTGSATTLNHNLTVVPELMIVKNRTAAFAWTVYTANGTANKKLNLSTDSPETAADASIWNNTLPTASVFSVGTDSNVNASSNNYVAYLFATCPGVSKVGTYTGNGGTQAIACGFTGGARFVLIKRTDSNGDWYVYDTARGMTLLTDPYLRLNSGAAESATLGSVTTTTGGFTLDATVLAAINASGGTYIFLAIA